MFDAKSLLEMIAKGTAGAPQQSQAQGSNPLEDLLRQFTQGGQAASPQAPQATSGAQASDGGFGGIGDLLNKIQQGAQGAGGQSSTGQNTDGANNITDLLGQVFGQATAGVKEGAQKIDDATGAGDQLRQMFEKTTGGKAPEDLMEQVKQIIANNQLGAGAAIGGLGALILGTKTGRGLAMGAAKLGALALISGLAYKAYQNYSDGKPILDGGQASDGFTANPEPAPSGSGFEPAAVSNDTATTLIRAMLAAAAADGRIDPGEQQKVLGSLQQSGLEQGAEEFIGRELQNPATAAELAAAATTKQEAVQIYTAARIAVDLDNTQEHAFLTELAKHLNIEPDLVAHIDAQARSTT